ncbi:MAG: acetyl-CoA carboxylase biotin carboxyl carrier protein subunit [Prolixibacteraceae bacterium]
MPVEIKLNDRVARIKILNQNENLLEVMIDDQLYQVDLMHNDEGAFSILVNNRSHNITLVPASRPKVYTAYTLYHTYEPEVIDAASRYIRNRGNGGVIQGTNRITAPMPGKIVKVLVEAGQHVQKGQTAVIMSAMKMESEYKAPADGLVKSVHVRPGTTVESNQVLVEFE